MRSVNSIWGKSKARAPYWIHWPRIYLIRSLAHCVTNISYWLPLNEGFRCNCIKTNKYVIFVLCVSDSYVSLYQYLVTCGMLHWSSHWTNIWGQTYSGKLFFYCNIFFFLIRFIISTSVVRVKRASVSLFNVIFVLKEKRRDNRVLKIYWPCINSNNMRQATCLKDEVLIFQ